MTPVTENGTHGSSSFASSRTKDRAPGPPENFAVTYAGSDFIDLEWDDPGAMSQCVRGVTTLCQQISTQEQRSGLAECNTGGQVRRQRGDRVTHLEACTQYECWAAYPDPASLEVIIIVTVSTISG